MSRRRKRSQAYRDRRAVRWLEREMQRSLMKLMQVTPQRATGEARLTLQDLLGIWEPKSSDQILADMFAWANMVDPTASPYANGARDYTVRGDPLTVMSAEEYARLQAEGYVIQVTDSPDTPRQAPRLTLFYKPEKFE